MTVLQSSPFSAVDAALGYLYQVRIALLWTLRKPSADPDFLVSVETVDDVTFESSSGQPTDLLQTKHHRRGSADLTDSSPDLWKTLRIWFEGHLSGQVPPTANLYLLTTATAPDGSAASRLRAWSRDTAAAQRALEVTALSSGNQGNQKAYDVFRNAPAKTRAAILSKVTIIDAAPLISDLDGELRHEVRWAVRPEHHEAFLERLEGWWLRRVLRQLTGASKDHIGSVELEAQMADLRDQFRQDALPIDEDLLGLTVDEPAASTYNEYLFVKQLEIIQVRRTRLLIAIQDYYKAFAQRSRWLREQLVVDLELDKYDQRLVDEWTRVFEAMRNEIGEAETEEVKQKAARAVLRWADDVILPIRPAVTEPFVCRGSLHMLSDGLRIGWHPEFRERLASVLCATEEAG